MIDAMDLHAVVERTAAMYGAKGPRVIIACRCGQVFDSGPMHEGSGFRAICGCGRVWSTTEKPKTRKPKKAHAEAQRRRGT